MRRRVAFADGDMSYVSGGAEGPAVVFVHGAGLNAQSYRRLLLKLAGRTRVMAPDLRGHGQSSLPALPEELPDWRPFAQDLISFIDAAASPSDRPLILAGHLMGATVSLLAAGARPEFVRGLVLIEPVLYPPLVLGLIDLAQRFALERRLPFYGQPPRRRALWPSRDSLVESLRQSMPFMQWPEEALEDFLEGGVQLRNDGGVAFACDPRWETQTYHAQSNDLWALLDRVRCPIHVLRAAKRSKSLRPANWLLQMSTPATRVEIFRGSADTLPVAEPDFVAERIFASAGLDAPVKTPAEVSDQSAA